LNNYKIDYETGELVEITSQAGQYQDWCGYEVGTWRCVRERGHTGAHKCSNTLDFRESKTIEVEERSENQCCHTWHNLRCIKEQDHSGPCDMEVDPDYLFSKAEREQEMIGMETSGGPTAQFPFTLDDLDYWVVKRKDGIITKYQLIENADYDKKHPHKIGEVKHYPALLGAAGNSGTVDLRLAHMAEICAHKAEKPIWADDKGRSLSIANVLGLKENYKQFDLVLDCGHILNLTGLEDSRVLRGSSDWIDELQQYTDDYCPSIIRIDWEDREAPPLQPAFWPALAKMLTGKTVTACQGGHGRSGTSLVCLLMSLCEDYTPYDAVCHLRAMHCGRAIESNVQHQYIDEVGKHLGRETNVEGVKKVKDFRAAFLALTAPSAKPYQEQLQLSNKEVKK
jgi:hypothetical protein